MIHSDKTISRWQWLAFLTIYLLSAYGLIHNLDTVSLWADEGWTIAASGVDTPDKVITDWVAVDVHPPLFFLELWSWRQFSGDTIFAMRYFSVMLVLLGVAVAYRLGKDMFDSVFVGMVTALFFGLHDLVNVLTQEVRHYPQQQLMTALTLWLYWRFWQKPTRTRGIVFAIAGAALIWSHYWGGFVLLAMGVHSLLTRWRKFLPFIYAYVGLGLLYMPWLPAIYNQITIERPAGLPHALDNSWIVYKTLAYQLVGVPEIFWLGLALASLLVVGLQSSAPRSNWQIWKPHSGVVLLWLVIILTVGLSIGFNEFYPTLSFRSLAVTIPALAALIGYAMANFEGRGRAFFVLFLILQSLFTTSAQSLPRAPWVDYADYLVKHSTTSDLILMELDTDEYAVQYYIDQQTDNIRYTHSQSDRAKNPESYDFAGVLADYGGVWVAKFGWYEFDIRSELVNMGFSPASPPITWDNYSDGRPIEILRYERPPTTAPLLTLGERFALYHFASEIHPEWVTVNMLWSPLVEIDDFYTVSVFLLHESGQILTPESQHDNYPLEGRDPTLDWQADTYHFDSYVLSTTNLPAGSYQIGLKIYRAVDGDYSNLEILSPSTCADADCTYAVLKNIILE